MSHRNITLLSAVLLAFCGARCFGQARPYVPPEMQVTRYGNSWTRSPVENGKLIYSDGNTKVILRLNPSISLEIAPVKGGPGIASSGSLWTVKTGDKVLTSEDFEGVPVETYGPVTTIEIGDRLGLGLQGILSITMTDLHRLGMQLDLSATGRRRARIDFPTISGMRSKTGDLSYCMPRRESVIDSIPVDLQAPYCKTMPLQFTDVYGANGGIYLMDADRRPVYRSLHLIKDVKGIALAVEYPEQEIGPGTGFRSAAVTIGFHAGDWHTALEAYKVWGSIWFKPDPEKSPCDDADIPDAFTPAHLDMARFAYPSARIIATGPAKWAFFNGEGFGPESVDDAESVAKMRDVMKTYDDCFASRAPVPLIPTGHKMVFANQFPGNRRILWTLFNANNSTVHGELLAVRHTSGAKYLDAWTGRPIKPRIAKDIAYLNLELGPHTIGCIVKESHR